MNTQKKKLNCLDLNIKLIDGELKTDLFVKPMDTHQFLDLTSCHPYHCKKEIPYSQALRLNKICSGRPLIDVVMIERNSLWREVTTKK